MISATFVFPHPPIILPEVGGGREKEIQKTIDAYDECAKQIAEIAPDTIIVTSPHSTLYADYFHISPGKTAHGDLSQFDVANVKINCEYDTELVSEIEKTADVMSISAGTFGEREPRLDHGTIIPLSFVNKYFTNYRLVRIGLSGLSVEQHYKLGMCIAKSVETLSRKVVVIASGDLSHKLPGSSYGCVPEGAKLDKEITKSLSNADFLKLCQIPPELSEKGADCGLKSFIIMAGTLDRCDVNAKLLSYEGTFGVGYAVACFIPNGENSERNFLIKYELAEQNRLLQIKENESEQVKLARYSLEHFVKTGMLATLPDNLSNVLTESKAGVFVCIKKHGGLRGCIGTIAPVTNSIAEEVLRNAVSAASEDPRFEPVLESELNELVYTVDLLSPPEKIDDISQLDVKKYGVIVTSGYKRGLLLPNLDGINTIEQQVEIAMKKGGIKKGESIELQRFEVVRYT